MNGQQTRSYIPTRLNGIKVGDMVRFRTEEQIFEDYSKGLLNCGWCSQMRVLCGTEFPITEKMMENIQNQAQAIVVVKLDGPTPYKGIELNMLEFVTEKEIEEIPQPSFSILVNKKAKDPAIVAEMIKKVDRVRFKKLLAIGANSSWFKYSQMNDEIVETYLNRWANAKYEIYLLFDKKLVIDEDIELDMSETEMRGKLNEISMELPAYASLLQGFSMREWLGNECREDNSTLRSFYQEYRNGAVLSTMLAKLVRDDELRDKVANLMQTRKIKSKIAVSIDPYDYLTMSQNNHGWQSCQRIDGGEWTTGTISLMFDEATMIAYKHSGIDQPYNIKHYKFTGNSKSWRQCIYLDKETSGFATSRQYPYQSGEITKAIRALIEKRISEYFEVPNRWIVSNNQGMDYKEGSETVYHDLNNGHDYKVALLKAGKSEIKVEVGSDIICVSCGRKITGSRDKLVCKSCGNHHDDGDDDDYYDEDED